MDDSNPEPDVPLGAETPPAPDTPPDPETVDPIDIQLGKLPAYARGLMEIRVPVCVTLAAQRKSIHEIIELGPGSIVKFEKTCDEPLELTVCDRPFAIGEVVKVGDKFGLRIGTRV
jgi:flagellar motor switch protein FliN/FliY